MSEESVKYPTREEIADRQRMHCFGAHSTPSPSCWTCALLAAAENRIELEEQTAHNPQWQWWDKALSDQEREIARLRAEVEKLSTGMLAMQRPAPPPDAEVERLEAINVSLLRELDQLNERTKDQSREIADLEDIRARLRAEVERLTTELSKAEQQLSMVDTLARMRERSLPERVQAVAALHRDDGPCDCAACRLAAANQE